MVDDCEFEFEFDCELDCECDCEREDGDRGARDEGIEGLELDDLEDSD